MSLPPTPDDTYDDRDFGLTDYTADLNMTPAEANALLTATRRNGIARYSRHIERVLEFVRDHWLATINVGLATYIGIALATPLAFAAGLTGPASAIFNAFHFLCAQTPSHSFFIAGYQTC